MKDIKSPTKGDTAESDERPTEEYEDGSGGTCDPIGKVLDSLAAADDQS